MRKILYIVFAVLISLFFIFGISYQNNSNSNFQYDGYFIETSNSNKQYFSANSEYRLFKTKNVISFNNTNNEKVQLPTDSFVHFLDGSLSVLKKSAVVDLSNMNKTSFEYYTVYDQTVFTKSGGNYKIAYLDKQLSLKEFIVKISEDKYFVASPSLTVKNGNNSRTFKSGYTELTFYDGDIVKLQNKEEDIQNVPHDMKLYLNDNTYINLENKKIYYNNEAKLNLGEITINSDDNIEILPDENNTQINGDLVKNETKTDNKTNNNNNTSSSSDDNEEEEDENNPGKKKIIHKGDFVDVANGVVDAPEMEADPNTPDVVEENEKIKDPVYEVEEFSVSADRVTASISITDVDKVLVGNTSVKIIRLDDNQLIYYEQDSRKLIQIDVGTLKPETNYVLIMNSDYKKNEMTYNKDFIQKTFVTSGLGVNLEKKYVKTTNAKYSIAKSDYSKVESVTYELFDNTIKSTTPVANGTVDFTDSASDSGLTFNGLSPDHEYLLKLYNYVYDMSLLNDNEDLEKFMTLKTRPNIGDASFSVNKQVNKYIVSLNNVTDLDKGVKQYRAEVYNAETNQFVTSRVANTNANIEFDIDENLLSSNLVYRVYAYLIFNDNEMEYEIPIGSDYINTNGIDVPVITFYRDQVTFERIKGRILITDNGKRIDAAREIVVTYQNEAVSGSEEEVQYNVAMEGNTAVLEFDKNNLKADSVYLFTVKAYISYHDGNGYELSTISQFKIRTDIPKTMTVDYVNLTSQSRNDSFKATVQLRSLDPEEDTTLEASVMRGIKILFYSAKYNKETDCISSNGCWTYTLFDDPDNINDHNDYNSALKDKLYDHSLVITQDTLNIPKSSITYGQYYLEIASDGAFDYTIHPNILPIESTPLTISANTGSGGGINQTNPVTVKSILKDGSALYPELNDNTQTGFSVKANLTRTECYVQSVTYTVYDGISKKKVATFTKNINGSTGSLPWANIYFSKDGLDQDAEFIDESFLRGKPYYFQFSYKYRESGTGFSFSENGTTKECSGELIEAESGFTREYETEKQAPTFTAYQSNRDEENVYFNYIYRDVDDAVTGTKEVVVNVNGRPTTQTVDAHMLYWYKDSDTTDYYGIEIFKNDYNDNNEKTLAIPLSSGTVSGYYSYILKKKGAAAVTSYPINYTFSTVIGSSYDFSGITYRLEKGNNVANIILINSADIASRIISADVTITDRAGITPTTTLRDLPVENNTIMINFSEIKQFKSTAERTINIVPSVKVYYDAGIYGIQSTDLGYGYAFQYSNGKYYTFSKTQRLGIDKENFEILQPDQTKQIRISKKSSPSVRTNLYYFLRNSYTYFNINDAETRISIKQVNAFDSNCISANACDFNFDQIYPTMTITRTAAGVSTGYVYANIVGVEEEDIPNFEVHIDLYKCENDICSSLNNTYQNLTPNVTKQMSLTDFNSSSKITIEGLEQETKYRIYYHYYLNGSGPLDFYFSNSRDYSYYSEIKTSNNIGIRNVYATYSADRVANTRELLISYLVNNLDGVDGIEYQIYTLNSNNEKLDATYPDQNGLPTTLFISDDTDMEALLETRTTLNGPVYKRVNIDMMLSSGGSYYIDILPYVYHENSIEKDYLTGVTGVKFNFTIPEPVINASIQKNSENQYFARVYFSDYYNAFKDNTSYTIKLVDGSNSTPLSPTDGSPIDAREVLFYNVTGCTSTDCYVEVTYNYEIDNVLAYNSQSGTTYINYLQDVYDLSINSSADILIGDVSAVATSNNGIVRLRFSNSYKVKDINLIRYTVYGNGGSIVANSNGVVPTWRDENTTTPFTDLEIALQSGQVYTINLQFYRNGEFIDSSVVTYAK